MIDQGACLTVSGSITTGYDDPEQPNPNADLDAFTLQVPAGAYFQVTYGSLDMTDSVLFGWVDLQTATPIELQCGEWQADGTIQCEGISLSQGIVGGFGSRVPEDYTITVSVGQGSAPAPAPGPVIGLLKSSVDTSSYSYDGSDFIDLANRLR